MPKLLTIIHEDESIIVVDKPVGLLVIPAPDESGRTLTDILNEELTRRGKPEGSPANRGETARAHPCHRLDRETSGLTIYAKGKATQQRMMEEFHKHRMDKGYICFVQRYVTKDALKDWVKINIQLEGKQAVTRYKLVKYDLRGFSVVEVQPLTGLTNQIRLHFMKIGHPLVGERKFAFARDYPVKFNRVALHASYLGFNHPITDKRLELHSPLPPDMAGFIQ